MTTLRRSASVGPRATDRSPKISRPAAVGIGAVLLIVVAGAAVSGAFRADMAAARQKVISGSSVLTTEHGDIEYAIEGAGPPVLILHGSGGGYDQGLLLGRTFLGGGLKKIAVSRFGYLRSTLPLAPNDTSAAAQAATYVALLDHLGVERVIVLAGSGGGPSALQFAHDFPERTSALILVSAVTKTIPPEEQDARSIAVIQTVQRSDFLFWAATEAFQSQFLELIGLPREEYNRLAPDEQALAHQMLDVMHPMSLRRIGSFREGEQRPLDATALARIEAPTLIVHAKNDSLVTYQHAEHAHRSIQQSTLVLFDTGGHGLLANVSIVREHVSSFLDDVLAALRPGP